VGEPTLEGGDCTNLHAFAIVRESSVRSTKRCGCVAVLFAAVFFLAPARTPAQEMVVGVNVVNPLRASVADQNILLSQLKEAQVRVIRCGISNDDKGIDFAKRAAAQGMRIQLITGPQYPPNAPTRSYKPDEFPAMWSGHPLSFADRARSKTDFQHLFDSLDANGIALAGVELGNEINWAAFNPEFPLPGEGKILSLQDLDHDPEGKQIAKGFLQYIEVLEALKEVRDHSRLNRSTPIILAGLVCAKDGEKLYNNKKEDMVGLAATIAFLRAHGLDSLVDAYGVHSYPSPGQPGNPTAAAQRAARLNDTDLSECHAEGTAGGKPCWITEWGFPNTDLSCPAKETGRTLLIEELRGDFARPPPNTGSWVLTTFLGILILGRNKSTPTACTAAVPSRKAASRPSRPRAKRGVPISSRRYVSESECHWSLAAPRPTSPTRRSPRFNFLTVNSAASPPLVPHGPSTAIILTTWAAQPSRF
jgi:hypothetical protein